MTRWFTILWRMFFSGLVFANESSGSPDLAAYDLIECQKQEAVCVLHVGYVIEGVSGHNQDFYFRLHSRNKDAGQSRARGGSGSGFVSEGFSHATFGTVKVVNIQPDGVVVSARFSWKSGHESDALECYVTFPFEPEFEKRIGKLTAKSRFEWIARTAGRH
jgi:hypothetical protein